MIVKRQPFKKTIWKPYFYIIHNDCMPKKSNLYIVAILNYILVLPVFVKRTLELFITHLTLNINLKKLPRPSLVPKTPLP